MIVVRWISRARRMKWYLGLWLWLLLQAGWGLISWILRRLWLRARLGV